ncbi:MAG TPA: glycosyltransferase [Jatrophihabitantaceae bacterium]
MNVGEQRRIHVATSLFGGAALAAARCTTGLPIARRDDSPSAHGTYVGFVGGLPLHERRADARPMALGDGLSLLSVGHEWCEDLPVRHVEVQAVPLDRLDPFLTGERADRLRTAAVRVREALDGRVVWNVNATSHGGGVAEMLQYLLAYGRGAGVDVRWLVLDGDHRFFEITKRLHNALHGAIGDGGPLGDVEQADYRRVLDANLAQLSRSVRPDDVVLLHDPQAAGLVSGLRALGTHVVWRCHIGIDIGSDRSELGWAFLRRHLEQAEGFVFSRAQYVPPWLPSGRVRLILPSIDPNSVKNRDLDPYQVARILRRVGLLAGGDQDHELTFARRDGSVGSVRRHTDLIRDGAPPAPEARLVVQVSRWDRLKDMAGVLSAFSQNLLHTSADVHLMLAGPEVSGVTDDPEGADVLASCRMAWRSLSPAMQERVHLVCVPMDDADENAIIINALQRHATVVAQKSLGEGFGLTVTEAMWKARPVLASAVGGINDQIVDGRDGRLLQDPRDLDGFVRLLNQLLADEPFATGLGVAARARVADQFLSDRHLIQYSELFTQLVNS